MRCRNFEDGEVIWFGSKGIKNQSTNYQEIDITNSGVVADATLKDQPFKIQGTKRKEYFIDFYDQYGEKIQSVSTLDLPLRTLPELDYNPNYTFSWDRSLNAVNQMTKGGSVVCNIEGISGNYKTEIFPIDEGFPIGDFTFRITNGLQNDTITVEYPDGETDTIEYTQSWQSQVITHTFESVYHEPIIITNSDESLTYYLGYTQGSSSTTGRLYNFYGTPSNPPTESYEPTNFNSILSIKEVWVAPNSFICGSAFRYNSNFDDYSPVIERLIIPNNINTLEGSTFYKCRKLKTINMHTTIGNNAEFLQCYDLEYAVLPNLTSIGAFMFEDCTQLKNIVYSVDSISRIETMAFSNCSQLESFEIGGDPQHIGTQILHGCKGIKVLKTAQYNPTASDQYDAYKHFASLFEMTDANTEAEEGWVKITSNGYYYFIPSALSSVILTKGDAHARTTIKSYAFENMTTLKSVSIGESVVLIQANAFKGCSNLTFIVLENEQITIQQDAFADCDNLIKGFYGDIEQADIVLYNGNDKVAYITLQGEYTGVLTSPITSVAVYNNLYDNITLYLYPITNRANAENFVGEQLGVASGLNQKLSVIKGELWYAINTGLPLFDKVSSKVQMDASVLQIVNSNKDIIGVKSFESYIQGHTYNCKLEVVSRFGDLTISF